MPMGQVMATVQPIFNVAQTRAFYEVESQPKSYKSVMSEQNPNRTKLPHVRGTILASEDH
jgi:hypothetical protein